jgi:hypothetical protein
MKNLLTLAGLVATMACGAQDCNPYKDEVDPITKERKVIYKTRPAVGAWFVGNGPTMHIELSLYTYSLSSIQDQALITFLFQDDTTLELRQDGLSVSDYVSAGHYNLSAFAWLDREQLALLSTKDVKLIRWRLSEYNKDVEINGKKAAELRQAAHCLATTF